MSNKQLNFGIKLWSINNNYIDETIRLFVSGYFQFIELYIVPGSYDKYINFWLNLKKKYDINFVIHAPHYNDGMNLANKKYRVKNLILSKEAIDFANILQAKYIIFHPGINGEIFETAKQFKKIMQEYNENRILVENKPYYGLGNDLFCNGSSPEEIALLIRETDIGFCLDIGHSICAANAQKIKPMQYINQFLELKPKMFHLTDGIYEDVYDKHLHFKEGNFPIEKILKLLPYNTMITNEAKKNSMDNLEDFVKDICYVRNIEENIKKNY